MIRVWDVLVRGLHWSLAAALLTALASGHWPGRWFDFIHHGAGYVAAGAVVLRVAWGLYGSRYARFRQFLRGPRATWDYARQWPTGSEPRYIGHNPLGGWMVLALLATALCASLSGWLYTTEWLWGYEWLSDLHAVLAWLLVVLVPVHLAGVVMTSIRHRENLIAAMLNGHKRAPAGNDVDAASPN